MLQQYKIEFKFMETLPVIMLFIIHITKRLKQNHDKTVTTKLKPKKNHRNTKLKKIKFCALKITEILI